MIVSGPNAFALWVPCSSPPDTGTILNSIMAFQCPRARPLRSLIMASAILINHRRIGLADGLNSFANLSGVRQATILR